MKIWGWFYSHIGWGSHHFLMEWSDNSEQNASMSDIFIFTVFIKFVSHIYVKVLLSVLAIKFYYEWHWFSKICCLFHFSSLGMIFCHVEITCIACSVILLYQGRFFCTTHHVFQFYLLVLLDLSFELSVYCLFLMLVKSSMHTFSLLHFWTLIGFWDS